VKQIRFTKEGYEKQKQEYEELLKSRPDAVAHLKKAREMGDLSENGYYKASRAKLSSIDHRLFRLKLSIKQAVIMDNTKRSVATIGSDVILFDGNKEEVYKIVGDLEANPREGKISLLSPLGRAIEGRQKGEKIEVESPKGIIKYTLKDLK
jgi:transcription elongation factor GreA